MKEVFKNTVLATLLNKTSIYTLLFGSFFLLLVYSLGFSMKIETSGHYLDLTPYKTLLFLQVFLYLFYASILVNSSGDLQEEIKEGFSETVLVYLTRKEYFLSKLFSYIFSHLMLLILTVGSGAILCKILLQVTLSWKFFLGFFFICLNIILLISLLLLFSLYGSPKGSGFFSFLVYVFLSFLNSKGIMNLLIGSERISAFISSVSPSVFWTQNEFLRFSVGLGFSDKLSQSLLNFSIYLLIIFFLLILKINRYECKA